MLLIKLPYMMNRLLLLNVLPQHCIGMALAIEIRPKRLYRFLGREQQFIVTNPPLLLFKIGQNL